MGRMWLLKELSSQFLVGLVSNAGTQATNCLVAWVASYEEEDDGNPKAPSQMISSLPRAHAAQHHYAPGPSFARRTSQDGFVETVKEGSNAKKPETGFFGGHREPVKGRKWDHIRDAEPVIMQGGDIPTASPWVPFIRSSMYAPAPNEDRKIVTPEFLQQQTPGYERPWRGDLEQGEGSEKFSALIYSKKKRKSLLVRFQVCIDTDPFEDQALIYPACSSATRISTARLPSDSSHDIHCRSSYIIFRSPSFQQIYLCSECFHHHGNCSRRGCHSIYLVHHL